MDNLDLTRLIANGILSQPQPTIEAAQDLYQYELFNPAAVLETPDRQYFMVRLRVRNWPPHEGVQAIERITGFKAVSCADPICGIWKPYQAREGNDGQ